MPEELVTMDALFQGQAFGNTAQRLLANGMNSEAMRPWIEGDFVSNHLSPHPLGDFRSKGNFISANGVARPVANATLRKDEWKQYDDAILKAAQVRLQGVADLYSRGLTFNINNGLGTTDLE